MSDFNFTRFWSILFLFSLVITAQQNSGYITEIEIIGNKHTDDNVILRELLIEKGQQPDSALIAQSKKRLDNLLLFNRVEIYTIPDNKNYILIIEVTERLYLFPFPIFEIHDRDWDKISYGISLSHHNFRGQNEQLGVAFWFGYQPGYTVFYTDQWAGENLHLTLDVDVMNYTMQNRGYDFNEKHNLARIGIGKWWNYHLKTEFIFLYDQIRIDKDYKYLMRSGKNKEELFTILYYTRYDTRDYYAYPADGWYNRLEISKNGFFQSYNQYWHLMLDMRRYDQFGSFILATRFNQNYQFGKVPVYRTNYIGFLERIRGRFYEIFEGKNFQTANIELRFPIIPAKYLSYDNPFIPDLYTRDLKYGLSGEIFADAGIIWSKPQQYNMNNVISGFGTGIYIHMPYIEVFRIDLAFDLNLRPQLIAEIGISI